MSLKEKVKAKRNAMIAQNELAEKKKYRALAMFADGLPWDKDRYIRKTQEALETHFQSGIEAGKRLIVLKEMLPHGAYVQALEHIGIKRTSAWNYMKVAERFCGFDSDIAAELGVTKLYALLKAPEEELQKIEENGSFLDIDKETLVAISTRELERRIKEATGKLKEDREQLDARVTVLTNASHEKDREIERLKKEAIAAYTGKKAEKPLPEWWNEFTGFLNACTAFQAAIQQSPPDLQDKETLKSSDFVLKRIEHEVMRVTKYLRRFDDADWDPVAFREATEEKLASLPINDNGEIDVTKLGRAD